MAPDASHGPAQDAALDRIKDVVGEKGWSDDLNDHVPYVNAFRGGWEGKTALLVRPASTHEVSEVMTICADAKMPVVPQGGNTGLTGASVPDASGEQILLSLDRMTEIRDIDPLNYTITVDAGCILANIQDAASDADRFFPLPRAQGSAGSAATSRPMPAASTCSDTVMPATWLGPRSCCRTDVFGRVAAPPEGQYRLRLEATVRRGRRHARHYYRSRTETVSETERRADLLCGDCDREAMIELLTLCRAASGDSVTSFEYIPRIIIDIDMRHLEGIVDPMEQVYEHYALIEFSGANPDSGMQAAMESMLESAFEDGIVLDAAISQSEAHRNAFWFIRDGIVEASKDEGPRISHYVSVPVRDVPRFLEETDANSARNCPMPPRRLRPCRRRKYPLRRLCASRDVGGRLREGLEEARPYSARKRRRIRRLIQCRTRHRPAKESLHAGVSFRNRVGHDA